MTKSEIKRTNMPQEPQPETPRTDRFESDNTSALKAGFNDWPDFARTLERELNEANKKLERYHDLDDEYTALLSDSKSVARLEGYDKLQQELAQVRKEIAGYRSACEGWQQRFVTENTEKNELKQERDLPAKQNHKLKEALEERIKSVELLLMSQDMINNRAAAIYYLHPHNEASPLSDEVRYTKWEAIGNKGMYLQIARWHFDNELTDLRQILASVSDLSSLIVLSRAEIESWPCKCFDRNGNNSNDVGIIKCIKHTLLERFTK